MYPVAPVRRMREVLGIAAGFGTMVGSVIMSASHHDGDSRRDDFPRESIDYFFLLLFLMSSRVARYSLFSGSAARAFSMKDKASAFFSAPIATRA